VRTSFCTFFKFPSGVITLFERALSSRFWKRAEICSWRYFYFAGDIFFASNSLSTYDSVPGNKSEKNLVLFPTNLKPNDAGIHLLSTFKSGRLGFPGFPVTILLPSPLLLLLLVILIIFAFKVRSLSRSRRRRRLCARFFRISTMHFLCSLGPLSGVSPIVELIRIQRWERIRAISHLATLISRHFFASNKEW
jgi:hypothetical protein